MNGLQLKGFGAGALQTDASGNVSSAGAGSGTVTSVSVTSANGLAGTVATATTTPAITLSTTITGLLKGNGTAISAATSGTDYAAPNANTTGSAGSLSQSLTSGLPIIGNTTGITAGTRSGNTTKYVTTTGTLTSGHCVDIDASGNMIDAGAVCGGGGGSGTVTSVGMPAQWGGGPITVSGAFTSPAPNVTAKTTTYAMTTSDYEIRTNCASACTVTMPAPGSAGAHYLLKNYATSTYALVTLAPHASETFCGEAYASVHMSTPGEYWEFIDDGTNWSCAQHHTQTTDISYSLVPAASTTNPVIGTTSTNSAYWSRNGNKMTVNYAFAQTAGGGTAGSGTYFYPIFKGTGSDFAVNTTAYPANTNATTGVVAVGGASTLGSGMFFGACQTTKSMAVQLYDSTDFKLWVDHDDTYFTSGYCTYGSTTLSMSWSATVPISNWEP